MVRARLTPDTPTGFVRRCILVPDTLLASVGGALAEMANTWAWETFGTLSVEDTVILCKDIEDSYKDCVSMLGSIAHFYGNLPEGYLPADGSTYNQVDYPELYDYLGAGGGTFDTPDLTGVFVFGASGSSPLGDTFGQSEVVLALNQMPRHSHGTHTHFIVPDLPEGLGAPVPVLPVGLGIGTQASTLKGNDQPHDNMPPAHSVVVAIRAVD